MLTWQVGALVLLLFLQLTGCQKTEPVQPLRLAQTENLYSLDPDRAADAQSRAILANVYEALVEFDRDLKIGPALAINWNAPDELTWVFELRKGVQFHNGQILTAADVKSSLDRVGGPGFEDPIIGISSVDVIGKDHVRLRLQHPAPLLLNRLTQLMIVPAQLAAQDLNLHPIGTGPYRIKGRTQNDIDFEAFPQHWRGKPSIERVKFSDLSVQNIPDAFLVGHLDIYRLFPTSMLKKPIRGVHVAGRSGLAVMDLWFNCSARFDNRKNPFADTRVRHAISLALDRNRLVQSLGGKHTPMDQLIPNGVFGFIPDWAPLLHDPEEARRLIQEAGYQNGFDTTLAHPRGETYRLLATTVRQMLEPVGIHVSPKELRFEQFLEARRNQQLPFFALSWTFDDGDAWTFLMASLHSKTGPQDFRSTNPGYSNPALDRLIEQSQEATSIDEIGRRYEAILKIAISELPIIPLYRRYDLYGVSDRVRFDPRLDGKLLAAEMQLQLQ